MRQGTIHRALAAASATAMAGAALVVSGAGVAAADPARAVQETDNTLLNNMRVTREVDEGVVTFGDVVTVTTKLERLGGVNTNLIYWMRDYTPDCFKLVDVASNPDAVTWRPSNGTTYTIGSKPKEVEVTSKYVEVNPPALNSHEPPIMMAAKYEVTCDAGLTPTGGFQFDGTTNSVNLSTMGPSITVRRMGTSVWLAQPVNPEVGQKVTLRANTIDVPDGGLVGFSVDGVHVGNGPVSGGQATLEWTPTTAGTKHVTATFGEAPTHGGSTSQNRTVVVSPTNVASSVTIATSGELKVGVSTRITATVSPAGAGGEVEFFHDGVSIGPAPVGADGTASIDWIPSVAGQRSIDANFSGRTGVNPSNAGLAVTIAEAAPGSQSTTTTLEDIEPVQVGQETTLKATVAAGEVGGTVTFHDGSTVIGTATVQPDGTATMPWTPTTDGDRTIRAVYSGHGVYLASQDTKSVFIAPKVVNPDPDPDPGDPTEPGTGSLGSLTGSGGGDNASGSLGSLSSFGS